MNRTMAAVHITLVAITALPLSAQTRHFPDTRSGVHLFSDQLQEGMTLSQYSFAANRYAGCQKMRVSDVRNLRLYNPGFIVLHYQLGCGNGPAPFIDGDGWTSDWDHVTGQESWFMHQGGSRLHQPAWDWYLMDITAGSYRSYWIEQCKERMRHAECDGVFADSFTIDGYFDQLTPAHPWFTDINQCLGHWVPRLEAYADMIHNDFASSPERFYFLPNLGGLVTSWDTTDYAALGDGGMVEGFGGGGTGAPFGLDDWKLQMNRSLQLVRPDRIVICQSYTSDGNTRERMFLLGCYLLIKGNHTYFNMIGDEHGEELLYYPEYGVAIGSYTGEIPSSTDDLYDSATGCYRRAYSNGLVLVNPGEEGVHIGNLGGTYQLVSASGGGAVNAHGIHSGSLSYRAVTGVDLPAHSAAILLGEVPLTTHTVTLALDRASFSNADTLTLQWQISAASGAPRTFADAYVAVMTPGGELYFYTRTFTGRAAPIAPWLRVTDRSGTVGPFSLAGLPAGNYTWHAVLVIPGSDPLRASNWFSNLATAGFTINQTPHYFSRPFMARPISLSAARLLIASRLSYDFFPFTNASSTFARPLLKYSRSGTIVSPF